MIASSAFEAYNQPMIRDEAELAKIYSFEQARAHTTPPTSTPAALSWEYLDLPKKVEGLRILDVASGASPLVAKLLEAGADAHGFDAAYEHPLDLIVRVALALATQTAMSAGPEWGPIIMEEQQREIAVFRDSYSQNPNRYHHGYMTRLEFSNDSFDRVVSNSGLVALGDNIDATEEAIHNFHRVTKPGGMICITPWITEDDCLRYDDAFVTTYVTVLSRMQRSNLGEIVIDRGITPQTPIPNRPVNRLKLRKSA